MAFLPKPGEIIEDAELYELSGDEDDRLRQEYETYRDCIQRRLLRLSN